MKNRLALMVGALILGLSAMTMAQEQPTEEQSDVRSSVARISLIHGDVSTQRGDSGDWATAVLNQPIIPGNSSHQHGGFTRAEGFTYYQSQPGVHGAGLALSETEGASGKCRDAFGNLTELSLDLSNSHSLPARERFILGIA